MGKRGGSHAGPRPGQLLTVRFVGYDTDGLARGVPEEGSAQARELEVRVPEAARGDVAEVHLEHVSPHRPLAWGRLMRVISTSPERVRSADERSHRCGGCSWAHLSAEAQVRAKAERLRDALAGAGLSEVALAEPAMVAAGETSGYRSRAKYVLARGRGGKEGRRVVLGAYAPRSHQVIPTVACPATETAVTRGARALAEVLDAGPWTIFDEGTSRGLLRYAAIRANHRGEVLITLVAARDPERCPEPPLTRMAASLGQRCPGLVGLTLDVNEAPGNVLFSGAQEQVLWGKPVIEERYGTARVYLTGAGFGQVNREQAAALYEAAARAALSPLSRSGAPPRCAWDLFSGAGPLSQVMARMSSGGMDVLGVERDAAAVSLARRAAQEEGLDRLRFEAQDASEWATAALMGGGASARPGEAKARARPEVVVLNPPRAGCRPALLEALAASPVDRIVYVSCSPETLARDLKRLSDASYRITGLQGFDLLPLTPHLESLAVLEAEPRSP